MLKVNEYFDGKVKSIGFDTESLPATVGVMEAGDYKFDTNEKELMMVINGELVVKLPGQDSWQTYIAGDSFEVAAKQSFQLRVARATAYLCVYG